MVFAVWPHVLTRIRNKELEEEKWAKIIFFNFTFAKINSLKNDKWVLKRENKGVPRVADQEMVALVFGVVMPKTLADDSEFYRVSHWALPPLPSPRGFKKATRYNSESLKIGPIFLSKTWIWQEMRKRWEWHSLQPHLLKLDIQRKTSRKSVETCTTSPEGKRIVCSLDRSS